MKIILYCLVVVGVSISLTKMFLGDFYIHPSKDVDSYESLKRNLCSEGFSTFYPEIKELQVFCINHPHLNLVDIANKINIKPDALLPLLKCEAEPMPQTLIKIKSFLEGYKGVVLGATHLNHKQI